MLDFLQDVTSCHGPHAVLPLLNESEDTLLVDCGSGATAAHLSSLMKQAEKTGVIYMVGVNSPDTKQSIRDMLEKLNAESILIKL